MKVFKLTWLTWLTWLCYSIKSVSQLVMRGFLNRCVRILDFQLNLRRGGSVKVWKAIFWAQSFTFCLNYQQNSYKTYITITHGKLLKNWMIITVKNTAKAVVKISPENNTRLERDSNPWPHLVKKDLLLASHKIVNLFIC